MKKTTHEIRITDNGNGGKGPLSGTFFLRSVASLSGGWLFSVMRYFKPYSLIFLLSVESEIPRVLAVWVRLPESLASVFWI